MLKNLCMFMAVLVFSMPFTTLAQHSTESVPERHVAESDAKRDSKRDVNEIGWFLGGFVGYGVGALVAAAGAILSLEASCWGVIGEDTQNLRETAVCLVVGGFAFTSLVPLVAVSLPPTPQPDRLLGKSPAYIDTYVSTYKKDLRRRRGAFSSIGCLSGFALSALLFELQ